MIEKKSESNDETLKKSITSITNKYQINTVKNVQDRFIQLRITAEM